MFNSGLNPSAVKTAIDEFFFSRFDYAEQPGFITAENPLAFRQASTDKATVITEEFGGPGEYGQTVEEQAAPEATIRSGNQVSRQITNFKKTLPIPKEYFDDDQFETVQRMFEMLGTRAKTTRDKNSFAIYEGGFSTYTSNDGINIWSASHTNLNGDTIDNLESGALTPAAFETLWRNLVEQKSQDGEAGGHTPVAFLVPPILSPKAHEFLKSDLKANTTDNNLNYWSLLYPGLQIFSSIYLGSAHAKTGYTNANTAHYLVSQNHSITRWVREGVYTRLVGWEGDDFDRWKYKSGFREKTGAVSWEGSVASTGA